MIEIRFSGQPFGTKVLVDGVEIGDITSVSIVHHAGEMPVITITRFCRECLSATGEEWTEFIEHKQSAATPPPNCAARIR